MGALKVGRVCIKTRGRETGKQVVVVEAGKGFVVVDGPNARRRKCNPRHLLPTLERLEVRGGAEIKFERKAKKERKVKAAKGEGKN